MRRLLLYLGLLWGVACASYAQNWTIQDSLRLQQLLQGKEEIELNRTLLQEMEQSPYMGKPHMSVEKQWMEPDATLPSVPDAPGKRMVLTLHPYTARTKYNWDPVYQKKIKVDANTWRSDPFASFKINLANHLAQEPKQKPSGMDLMTPFTREFWSFRAKKTRARTLEVLRTYGDSLTAGIKGVIQP